MKANKVNNGGCREALRGGFQGAKKGIWLRVSSARSVLFCLGRIYGEFCVSVCVCVWSAVETEEMVCKYARNEIPVTWLAVFSLAAWFNFEKITRDW